MKKFFKKKSTNSEELVQEPLARQIPAGISGLSQAEVEERLAAGAYNKKPQDLTRTTKQIVQDNCFTLFNFINIALAIGVILVGSPKNALFLSIIVINTLIGIFQEIRAKRTIDRLAVLSETRVQAVRGGQLYEIPQEEIVLDDVLLIATGNQVPSDGLVLFEEGLEIDESLLTGESDSLRKRHGSEVMSGSFVTAGRGFIQITEVGENNYAAKLAQEAKTEVRPSSELMNALNRMMKVLTFTIIPVGALLFYSQYQTTNSISDTVIAVTAALVSMIPEGLMLLTSVAFAVGAANLARKKTLIQTLPCIETLARVDTICLDKTGTITDGSLSFKKAVPYGENSADKLREIMSQLMNASPDENATAVVLKEHYPLNQSAWLLDSVVAFSSARKWSGVNFSEEGSFVLGAPEFLSANLPAELNEAITKFSQAGYRVLGIAKSDSYLDEKTRLENPDFIGLLVIEDNIRDNAKETFAYFANEGVDLKVISGDNPMTVARIATSAGIKGAENYVDMSQINENEVDFQKLVEEKTVFGRVTPYQKRSLVKALKANKHVTCMTGDGVNDILSLKEADVGVAMASGSDAARSVADVVLLNSDFSSMIQVLKEGRRVINNIQRVASMYLVKTIYSMILAVVFIFIAMKYPFEPNQLTPINALTVGIPSFFLALKPSYERIQAHFLANILKISVPGALTVILNVLVIQLAGVSFDLTFKDTSTMCVLLTGAVGFQVLLRVSGALDLKRKIMVGVLGVAFIACFIFFQDFFSFASLVSRNIFFYLPLLLGSRAIFNYISLVMEWVVFQLKKHKFLK